ncbi:MAG: hypothetical protein AAGJ83_16160 [Planctomycetota bacterium]
MLKSKGNAEKPASPLADLPLERLTRGAQDRIKEITARPTLVRQLPQQTIVCDPELFLFLARKPDTIIGIWDLMGITKVKTKRTGPYQFEAIDGSGTSCAVDLIYGDQSLHLFIAEGEYDGKFVQKPVRGRGLFILRHEYRQAADGSVDVVGTLDCYVKFESLGADLIARSLGGLIGKSADHNFAETAKFIGQISTACRTNPEGLAALVTQMNQVDPEMRQEFTTIIANVARRSRQAPMLQPPTSASRLARRGDPRSIEQGSNEGMRLTPRE